MSDPVPVMTPEAAPTAAVGLRDLSDTQYDAWLKNGDMPEPAEPELSPTPDEAAPGQASAERAPSETVPVESAKVTKPHKPRDDINARLGQLAEKNRLAIERAEKAERELAELRTKAAPAEATPAPAAPVAKAPSHVELVKKYQTAPDWPKLDDYMQAGFDDPYASMLAAQAAYIGEKQYQERAEAQTAQSRQAKAESNVDAIYQLGQTTHPDWDLTPLRGVFTPFLSEMLFDRPESERPLSVSVLNYFSKRPVEARALAAMEPLAAARLIGSLESQLSTSAPSRVAAPTKTLSDAPDPPQTLGQRHTPNAGDEVETAIRDRDTGRFIELQNKRELADMKAGRR